MILHYLASQVIWLLRISVGILASSKDLGIHMDVLVPGLDELASWHPGLNYSVSTRISWHPSINYSASTRTSWHPPSHHKRTASAIPLKEHLSLKEVDLSQAQKRKSDCILVGFSRKGTVWIRSDIYRIRILVCFLKTNLEPEPRKNIPDPSLIKKIYSIIIFIKKMLPFSFLDGPQPYTVFELFF